MGVTENLLKKIREGNGDDVDKEMLNARIKVAHNALHELMSSTHEKLGELIAKYGLELKLLDASLIFASRNMLDEEDYTAEQPLSLFSCFGSKEGIEQVTLNKGKVQSIVQVIESNAYYYDDPDYKHTDTFEDFCEHITKGFTVEELFSVMTEIYNNHVIPCGAAQRVYTGLIKNIEW